MRRRREIALDSEKRQSAMSSPVRQEILGHLVVVPEASVAALSDVMGVAPDGLYYHLARLVDAGLVEESPREGASGKTFRAVADRYAFPHGGAGETVDRALKAVGAVMRLVQRELGNALRGEPCERSGPRRELWSARMRCRLTAGELASVNEHLDAIEAIVLRSRRRPPSPAAKFFSLFVSLTPSPARRERPARIAPTKGAAVDR